LGEMVSRLPCSLNASPLILRMIRLYFGLGVGFDIKFTVNTKRRVGIKSQLWGCSRGITFFNAALVLAGFLGQDLRLL